MEFDEKLREELNFRDWTVKELSAATGVSVNTLNHYLNGNKSIPAADVAIKIARALNVSVEFLFGNDNTSISQKIIPSRIRSIAEKFLQLDEFDRTAVEALIDKMVTRKNKD
jgi:transcriptional regulator with XRE-family HTH domain